MCFSALEGIMIPFIGTAIGSACVFFMKRSITRRLDRILSGFAGGVMIAASIFSLIIPAIEDAGFLGNYAFIPASIGFLAGIFFLILLDFVMPYFKFQKTKERKRYSLSKTAKLVLAVTIHNLPEGMAVGIVFAGLLYGKSDQFDERNGIIDRDSASKFSRRRDSFNAS